MSGERWESDCRSQCQNTREACRLHYLSKHHLNSMWDKLLHLSFRNLSRLVEVFFFYILQHAYVYTRFLMLRWSKALDEWNICIRKPHPDKRNRGTSLQPGLGSGGRTCKLLVIQPKRLWLSRAKTPKKTEYLLYVGPPHLTRLIKVGCDASWSTGEEGSLA